MSAFICSDEHIATIVVRYGELINASTEDVQTSPISWRRST